MKGDLEDADTVTAELLMAPGVDTPDQLLEQILGRPSWWNQAACRDLDTALFFPVQGERPDAAMRACVICPVRKPCLAFALPLNDLQGVFGGTTVEERRHLRRSIRQAKAS